MDLFLASRFHAMVSALAAGVPTLLIGWSHKYREVMRQFDVEEWALGYEQVSAEEVIDRFDRLLREERDVRERIVGHLEEVRASAGRNFDLAVRLLAADGGRRSGGPPRLS
jgi:polysaccharide pyruvyl transferase WcaK-like protein